MSKLTLDLTAGTKVMYLGWVVKIVRVEWTSRGLIRVWGEVAEDYGDEDPVSLLNGETFGAGKIWDIL